MSDAVVLLIRVEISGFVSGNDLVAQLTAPDRNSSYRVEFGHKDFKRFRPDVLGHTTKILNTVLFPEAKEAVYQDNIHHSSLFASLVLRISSIFSAIRFSAPRFDGI